METYGEIIEKILKILEDGRDARRKDDKNLVCIRNYYVLKSDALMFKKLLELESTFYKLSTSPNPTKKNDELLKLAKVKSTISNAETDDYIKLIEILEASYSKKANELHEHLGYYVPREFSALFHQICKKLNVGPSVMIRDIYSEDAKETIQNYLKGNSFQFYRIQNHMLSKSNISIDMVPLVKESLTLEELIVFLANQKDLDINSLDLFISILGVYNYLELIKELYTLGVLDTSSYAKKLHKLLDNDEVFVDAITEYIDLTIEDNNNQVTR